MANQLRLFDPCPEVLSIPYTPEKPSAKSKRRSKARKPPASKSTREPLKTLLFTPRQSPVLYYPVEEFCTVPFQVPPTIAYAIELGAKVGISTSGGKDSQAMTRLLVEAYQHNGWNRSLLFALHSHLGRIEWAGTLDHIKQTCNHYELPMALIYPHRGMIEEWAYRRENIIKDDLENGITTATLGSKPFFSSATNRFCTDREKTRPSNHLLSQGIADLLQTLEVKTSKPFFSSATNRFCTKHLKVDTSDQYLRTHGDLVICAIGIRAEESPKRATKPLYQIRSSITTKQFKEPPGLETPEAKQDWCDYALAQWIKEGRPGRLGIDYHPILPLTLEQVWQACGTSTADMQRRIEAYQSGDWFTAFNECPVFWAYATSQTRHSCSQCVLASQHDIINGAIHNPLVWLELAIMELESGWDFKHKFGLHSLIDAVRSLEPSKLRRLHQTLVQLGLIQPATPAYMHELICQSPTTAIALWTEEFYEFMLDAIGDWQAIKVQQQEMQQLILG